MRGVLFFLLVATVIALLLPPLFTHGACTAEFDAVAASVPDAEIPHDRL